MPRPGPFASAPDARTPTRRSLRRRAARSAAAAFAVLALLANALVAAPARAANPPQMTARVLLAGHARVGAWMAISVDVTSEGPTIEGELRMAAGAQRNTQYSVPIELAAPRAHKVQVLYAQPPSFGAQLEVDLVSNGQTIIRQPVQFTAHDANQLVVGIVAEKPQGIVPGLDLLPSANGTGAAKVQLTTADLPERVEGWSGIDRLIWQDVDTSTLSQLQLDALRGWLAGGGRLIIAGGTGGVATLSGLPDDLLPYRPTATTDISASSLSGLLGEVPADAPDLPALSGTLTRGTALATSGDQVVAAEAAYGSGAVTILGFNPATRWIADSHAARSLWRRFIPPRSNGPLVTGDDSQLVGAVQQQPALALPPIGGLLVLLFGYILLIGPINYLVLRRLDRREWAWLTMPVLIAVFAVGAYAFGAALRGLDVIINEVAIVRGAPDTTEGMANVYLGVFSPSRNTYQLEFPGGALLSSTQTGDFVGSGDSQSLDVLQGDPARIRDLAVGFNSLRTVRAETTAAVPKIHADLNLVDGTLKGAIRNDSDQTLQRAAIVLRNSVALINDIPPGEQRPVTMSVGANQFGMSVSDRVIGQPVFGDPTTTSATTQQAIVRHAMLDQLTVDQQFGANLGLQSENPVLLAWGTRDIVDIRISGQEPRRTGNVLYYIPLAMTIRGHVAFDGDLMSSSVVDTDAGMFNKDPFSITMGLGRLTMAYQPVTFDGTLTATNVVLGMNFGGDFSTLAGKPKDIAPLAKQPCADEDKDTPKCTPPPTEPACDPNSQDCFNQIPWVEVFDRSGDGRWLRLPRLDAGSTYALKDPSRYVDPGTGTVLVRFVNETVNGIGFQFQLRIEGNVR